MICLLGASMEDRLCAPDIRNSEECLDATRDREGLISRDTVERIQQLLLAVLACRDCNFKSASLGKFAHHLHAKPSSRALTIGGEQHWRNQGATNVPCT